MKKTVTANVNGTVFHIEEDAYEKLQQYLSGIRGTFTGSSGSDEIMADIEARIAELFNERLQGRQVVITADVDHVITIMGRPEDFAGDTGSASTFPPGSAAAAFSGSPRHRRLFRDPDDHWVGGVLGGIAAYFNIDPLWLRIGFLVVTVAGWGSPVAIYLLLWMLVPKAATPADKLAMRGEPVTVDNIKRVFDEGAERFRAGAEKVGQEAQRAGERWSDPAFRRQQFQRTGAQRFLKGVVGMLGRALGLFLLLIGALLAFGFITGVFSGRASFRWNGGPMTESLDLGQLANAWFISPSMVTWAWVGVALFCLVPIIGILLGGIRLLFGVRVPRWLAWLLTPAWFAGLILLIVIGVRQATDHRQRERITEDVVLPTPADHVLRIGALHDPLFGDERERHSTGLDLLEIGPDSIQWGWAELDVKASDDTLFHLEVVRRANGPTVKAAQRRARGIRTSFSLTGDLLELSPVYTTDTGEKLRHQTVSYIVRVPEGSAVRFERNAARIIYDIDNTANTWDPDMVGRTWTMTAKGLAPGLPGDQMIRK
ncbi:MAG: PspC domain-containing protein [Flavobacteriales bacterium]